MTDDSGYKPRPMPPRSEGVWGEHGSFLFCFVAHKSTEVVGVGEGPHFFFCLEGSEDKVLHLRQVIWSRRGDEWVPAFHAHVAPLTPARPAHENDVQYALIDGPWSAPIDYALAPLRCPEILQITLFIHGHAALMNSFDWKALQAIEGAMRKYYEKEVGSGRVPDFARIDAGAR